MTEYMLLANKVILVTAAFAVLLFAAVLTSALVVQGDKHPDYWVTTAHDIVVMAGVAVLYMVALVHIFRKFFKTAKGTEA